MPAVRMSLLQHAHGVRLPEPLPAAAWHALAYALLGVLTAVLLGTSSSAHAWLRWWHVSTHG